MPPADGRDLGLFFLRNSPVLIAIAQNGESCSIVVSVGGSELASVSVTLEDSWQPDRVVFGEWDDARNDIYAINICPMLWYGGEMHEKTARSVAQMKSDLQTLAMLYEREVITPPG